MASLTKTERALRGPGVFEITLGVILSILLGAVLAAVYLVFKPVSSVKELPKEPVLGTIYFVQGSTDTSKSRQWMRKRQMLSEGGTADISFSEEELNAWIASVVPQAPSVSTAKPGATANDKQAANAPFVAMDRPNFRIHDDVLQMGLPTTISALGFSLPVIMQTHGHFTHGQNGYVFVADELYVGSLPTQLIPGLRDLIVNRLMDAEDIPADLRAAWGRLSLVAVEGNQLHLSLP